MSEWKRKRFWKEVTTTEMEGGFSVRLDGRPVRTPGKAPFDLPSRALAEAVAEEWAAQEGEIDPEGMPLTRLSNSAIDKVATQHAPVAEMIADYGASDLLCYRAERPEGLVARQEEHWDALLDWAAEALDIELHVQSGLMPIPQPEASTAEILRRTSQLDPFDLTALHEFVTLSGSWVIGYAALTEAHPPERLWQSGLVDELWQEEQWGEDEEAMAARMAKRDAFLTAFRFATLARDSRHTRWL
jgi:chaperone required for assembly of F1-ATPase